MKIFFVYLFSISISICLSEVERKVTVFSEGDSGESGAANEPVLITSVINGELLDKFNEVSGPEFPRKSRPFVRVFVDISGKIPILLKWYMPFGEFKEGMLEVKRLGVDADDKPVLDQRTIKINEHQVSLIRRALMNANPLKLPFKNWISDEAVDGSTCVFEFPLENSSKILVRNGLGDVLPNGVYVAGSVSAFEVAREHNLATFVMMLLMVAENIK